MRMTDRVVRADSVLCVSVQDLLKTYSFRSHAHFPATRTRVCETNQFCRLASNYFRNYQDTTDQANVILYFRIIHTLFDASSWRILPSTADPCVRKMPDQPFT
jgi:hypothetical protein